MIDNPALSELLTLRARARAVRECMDAHKAEVAPGNFEKLRAIEDRINGASVSVLVCGTDLAVATTIKDALSPAREKGLGFVSVSSERLSPALVSEIVIQPRVVLTFEGKSVSLRLSTTRPTEIGRQFQNELFVGDASGSISRKHAVVAFDGGGWTITDTSSSGTFLHGRRLEPGPQSLTEGDTFDLSGAGSKASATLRFEAVPRPDFAASRLGDHEVIALAFDAAAPCDPVALAFVSEQLRIATSCLLLLPIGTEEDVNRDGGATEVLFRANRVGLAEGLTPFSWVRTIHIPALPARAMDSLVGADRIASAIQRFVDEALPGVRMTQFGPRLDRLRDDILVDSKKQVMLARAELATEEDLRRRKEAQRNELDQIVAGSAERIAKYFADRKERIFSEREDKERAHLKDGIAARTLSIVEGLVPVTVKDLRHGRADIYLVDEKTAKSFKPRLHEEFSEERHLALQKDAHAAIVEASTSLTVDWAVGWIQRVQDRKGPDALIHLTGWLDRAFEDVMKGGAFETAAADLKALYIRAIEYYRHIGRSEFVEPSLSTRAESGGFVEFTFRHMTRTIYSSLTMVALFAMLYGTTANRTAILSSIGDALRIQQTISTSDFDRDDSANAGLPPAPAFGAAAEKDVKEFGGKFHKAVEAAHGQFESLSHSISLASGSSIDIRGYREWLIKRDGYAAPPSRMLNYFAPQDVSSDASEDLQKWYSGYIDLHVGHLKIGHFERGFPIWPFYAIAMGLIIRWIFRREEKEKVEKSVEALREKVSRHYKDLATDVLRQVEKHLQSSVLKEMEKIVTERVEPLQVNTKTRRDALNGQITKHAQAVQVWDAKIAGINHLIKDMEAKT